MSHLHMQNGKPMLYMAPLDHGVCYLIGSGFIDFGPTGLPNGFDDSRGTSVAGAIPGDTVLWGSSVDQAGVMVTAYVNSTDSVMVEVRNDTGVGQSIVNFTVYVVRP